jgi:hypothetical protein
LEVVRIPDDSRLTIIEPKAFARCSSLRIISIPTINRLTGVSLFGTSPSFPSVRFDLRWSLCWIPRHFCISSCHDSTLSSLVFWLVKANCAYFSRGIVCCFDWLIQLRRSLLSFHS